MVLGTETLPILGTKGWWKSEAVESQHKVAGSTVTRQVHVGLPEVLDCSAPSASQKQLL